MATKPDGLGIELNLPAMKRDLRSIRTLCRQRYLRHCSKWCGEMLMALQDVDESPPVVSTLLEHKCIILVIDSLGCFFKHSDTMQIANSKLPVP